MTWIVVAKGGDGKKSRTLCDNDKAKVAEIYMQMKNSGHEVSIENHDGVECGPEAFGIDGGSNA